MLSSSFNRFTGDLLNVLKISSHGAVQPNFHGMLPVASGAFAPLQRGAVNWSSKLRQAAAVCHSLTPVDHGSIAGDMAEKELFMAVEAHFLVCIFWLIHVDP